MTASAPMPDISQADLRPPQKVMRLSSLGAAFPTRLSFLRTLVRALHSEKSQVTRPVWAIDADGFGHAVYSLDLGGYTYSLVAFSNDLPPEARTDRVIATAWDTSFVLYDGVPDSDEITRLGVNAPLQEAGRFTQRDLVLSRANKSVRLFKHVTDALKQGRQPDRQMIHNVGYLMRTTAVYGNGKLGSADRNHIKFRPVLSGPFMAEMLTVWLIRGFTHDLVEHVGGGTLDRTLKQHLGIGNSTGLGMAPFLVSHPILLNNWIAARELALARCLTVQTLDPLQFDRILELANRVARHLDQWNVPDEAYMQRISLLRRQWADFQSFLVSHGQAELPFRQLADYSGSVDSDDLEELIAALILEVNPDLVDDLAPSMASQSEPRLEPSMKSNILRDHIRDKFSWALDIDFTNPKETHQFWYVSEEKLEPRLGLRHSEPGADLESPLDIARQIQALHRDLAGQSDSLAEFLLSHPHHRNAARRVQTMLIYPYSEIHDNLIARTCLPIDMLRVKLAFFGASKFDPKSDRWTRITLAQGAPLFDEVQNANADDWWLPVFDA